MRHEVEEEVKGKDSSTWFLQGPL